MLSKNKFKVGDEIIVKGVIHKLTNNDIETMNLTEYIRSFNQKEIELVEEEEEKEEEKEEEFIKVKKIKYGTCIHCGKETNSQYNALDLTCCAYCWNNGLHDKKEEKLSLGAMLAKYTSIFGKPGQILDDDEGWADLPKDEQLQPEDLEVGMVFDCGEEFYKLIFIYKGYYLFDVFHIKDDLQRAPILLNNFPSYCKLVDKVPSREIEEELSHCLCEEDFKWFIENKNLMNINYLTISYDHETKKKFYKI